MQDGGGRDAPPPPPPSPLAPLRLPTTANVGEEVRSLRFARDTPNGVSVGCNQMPSELLPRVCWRRSGPASRAAAAAAASASVPAQRRSGRECRRWRVSASCATASAPAPEPRRSCRLCRPFSLACACSAPSGGVECRLARAARARDRGLGRSRRPEDRCPFLALRRMPCTSSAGAGAERERSLASFLSASPLSGAGAARLEKLCQMFWAEPGAGLGWPARSDRGALARRTAGRGNTDRREFPRTPPSGWESERDLESESESWSDD
jgi:hypothetical protein